MAKTRRTYTRSDKSVTKTKHKTTKSGYKRKEKTTTAGGRKMVRKVKVKNGHIKSKVRRSKTRKRK